jgi:hypothetical protein
MKNHPARTCIGCRGVFKKGDVVRLVAGPGGLIIDYREKFPGRAAYVCPHSDCIKKALNRGVLPRALHSSASIPDFERFITQLRSCCSEKIKSLIMMAAKAGMVSMGYSAVRDAVEKGRVEGVLVAEDLSDGTREKILDTLSSSVRRATYLTKSEIGRLVSRDLVGIVAITDKGFSDAILKETARLNNLIITEK